MAPVVVTGAGASAAPSPLNQDRSGMRVAERVVVKATRGTRIAVQLPAAASARQRRELTAFARYCILRLERELGQRKAWLVEIAPSSGKYATRIEVHDLCGALEANGVGFDGALATWEAICRLEQLLRESCNRSANAVRSDDVL
jgi:hypothetical protein